MSNTDNTKAVMKGLADLRSRQIVLTKFNSETKDFYDDSYVFAIANSVYPIYHEEKYFETDPERIKENLPYYDTYKIPESVVTELVEFLDKKWSEKEPVTFYQLEGIYRNSWQGENLRPDLIRCLRYFFLNGGFDEEFWDTILTPMEYPTEASRITKQFDKNELLPY